MTETPRTHGLCVAPMMDWTAFIEEMTALVHRSAPDLKDARGAQEKGAAISLGRRGVDFHVGLSHFAPRFPSSSDPLQLKTFKAIRELAFHERVSFHLKTTAQTGAEMNNPLGLLEQRKITSFGKRPCNS